MRKTRGMGSHMYLGGGDEIIMSLVGGRSGPGMNGWKDSQHNKYLVNVEKVWVPNK